MNTNTVTMDAVPFNKYHLKLIAYCSGCPLVTGYVIGSVTIALSVMGSQIAMTPVMSGLIGMGTLLGMVFGSIIGGYLTDLIGRKKIYMYDFIFLTVAAILQFFITNSMQAFILRIVLGLGVGATFSIAGPYLAEFAPQKNRGNVVGFLNALWFIGYALSNVVCYLMLPLGDGAWRWMLVSSAVLTFGWSIAIRNMPESPRWLTNKGRGDEVPAILAKIGDNVILDCDLTMEAEKASFTDIFKNGYGKWVFFVAAFWTMQIIPVFAIGTYLPTIMEQMGFSDGNLQYLGSAIINCLYLIGLVPIFLYMDKAGRRPTLIASFLICTIALTVLGITANTNLPFWMVLGLFVLFGASNTAGGSHEFVYPNELFPTQIRATAVGFVTGLTRILSAVSTFFTPVVLENLGLQTSLYICAGISVAGLILSIVMAPETKDMNLSDAANMNNTSKTTKEVSASIAEDLTQ